MYICVLANYWHMDILLGSSMLAGRGGTKDTAAKGQAAACSRDQGVQGLELEEAGCLLHLCT